MHETYHHHVDAEGVNIPLLKVQCGWLFIYPFHFIPWMILLILNMG